MTNRSDRTHVRTLTTGRTYFERAASCTLDSTEGCLVGGGWLRRGAIGKGRGAAGASCYLGGIVRRTRPVCPPNALDWFTCKLNAIGFAPVSPDTGANPSCFALVINTVVCLPTIVSGGLCPAIQEAAPAMVGAESVIAGVANVVAEQDYIVGIFSLWNRRAATCLARGGGGKLPGRSWRGEEQLEAMTT